MVKSGKGVQSGNFQQVLLQVQQLLVSVPIQMSLPVSQAKTCMVTMPAGRKQPRATERYKKDSGLAHL
jgi:hypothetical protein